MKSVVHVVLVVMPVLVLTVLRLAVLCVVPWVVTRRLPMAATNLLRPLVPMQTNPPLSASAR
jgi:hypothetical protein